ncbi:unnamed protein product [Calypogeia fissa]
MCAFLSRPHQANPHMFERRNLCRADISSTSGVRVSRPSRNTFHSAWKFSQQIPSKTVRTPFSQLSTRQLCDPSLSNFVARSLGSWGFEFLQAESLLTLPALDPPLQSTEISNLYGYFSQILGDVTPIDVLAFTFVSTVLGIMAAYIVHELKDHGDSLPMGLLEQSNEQSNPRIGNSSSTLQKARGSDTADVWLNMSRSSSFFRSVCARCPSLSSSTAHHYVQKLEFKMPEFQRHCLPAPDGGTVALDWPSHLDMNGSKELENIMLLVCGTTEGSHEDGIVKFSQLVEQHGYFPIVFNPRGCGGSPVTTPRVFSAADSDDVRLAVQFIAKSRPWATILGIGWGLGANVLARYLGEEGSYTPLTAAVCIDNPFDLSSVARPISGSRWVDYNISLSNGLVQILDSSKMLFQGEKRGFDVSGALAATSARDFDQAISRIVHGYTTVEDFYDNTSSGETLGGVRIPLLCILHLEDYTRTQASIPQHVFETNAYTMLLVSNPSDSTDDHAGGASDWTHAVSLEWLAAVEISMLKGRHPHLSEFSPTIKLPRERGNFVNQFSRESLAAVDKKLATRVPGTTSSNSDHKEGELKDADVEKEESIGRSTLPSNASHGEGGTSEQKEESIGRSTLPSNASHGEGGTSEQKEESIGRSTLPSNASHGEGGTSEQKEESIGRSTLPSNASHGEGGTSEQKEESIGRSTLPSNASHGEGGTSEQEEESIGSSLPLNASHGEGAKASEISEGFEDQKDEHQPPVEGLTEAEEAEIGQVVQVTQAVMNVLDVTMPGTLGDAQKQQVLKAVGRGETIVTALEEAVPEEVRGKISASVSEVVNAQGLNLKIAGIQPSAAMLPAGMTDSVQEKLLQWTGEKIAPKSDVDVSSRSGDESSVDTRVNGKTPQSEDKKEKPSLNDGSVDALFTSSLNVGDQARDQGDQGKNNQEQPRGSVDGALAERKETPSGGSSESTSHSDNPASKSDGGDSGEGQSSASERKDAAKNMNSQADSGEANGRSVTESKGKVTTPSNDDLKKPQSDPPKASGATASSESPGLQVPQGDPTSSKGSDDRSAASGSQVPANSSNSPPPSSQVSQGDRPRPEVAADGSNSPPPTPQAAQNDSMIPKVSPEAPNSQPSNAPASQTDAKHVETTSDTPSSPPENSPSTSIPAPQNPPPPPDNSPPAPAPQNPPPPSDNSPPAPTPQNPPPPPDNSLSAPAPQNQPVPLPSVGEALQALTGFDDSTQMAVTNVFGVVESVLDQIEKDNPSAEANGSSEVSAGNRSNDATAEQTKTLEQNANNPEDEDRNNQGNSDKQSKEVALVPNNQDEGSRLQSSADKTDERHESKSKEIPEEVDEMDPVNRFSLNSADSRGVKPCLTKNRRGYIKDASIQQTEPGSREVQDYPPNTQSILFESSSIPVRDGPAEDIVNNGFFAESANEKRLQVMAAEIDAEGEQTAETDKSSPSDQVAADNCVSDNQENDSNQVADLVMNAVKLEIMRRLGSAGLEALDVDLEKEVVKVAHTVSELVTTGTNKLMGSTSHELYVTGLESNLGGKLGVLNGNSIVTALGSVLGSNSLLGRVLPFGVLVGVVMAALGAVYLIVADDQEEESVQLKRSDSQINHATNSSSSRRVGLANYSGNPDDESSEELGADLAGSGRDDAEHVNRSNSSEEGEEWNDVEGLNGSASTGYSEQERNSTEETVESELPHQGKLMGAMAAAMGATAAVASSATSTSERQSGDSERKGVEQNLVPDIAEKAVSIVSPVIPKTQAGELDHERLVAVLTEVGQRGGPLTLIGKAALLWGGLRGAMSLTDRLLAFFRIKDRPLHERLLGFGGMAVLLWTPVLVPLLPTLLQQWATKSSSGVADAAAGIGLYGAVFILVTIWGRRIRGYDRPLVSYGLQLFSRAKLRLFAGGLAIGFGMVSGYYGVNWVLGYSQFTWDAIVVTNPDFPGPLASTILTSWKVLLLVTQSLTKAVAVALVEEVLFRAWLQEEIAVDLGYNWAVILSALAFAIVHWSPTAVAGLWFFAVALSGARARTKGDLSLAIGIHAGIVTAFAVMTLGGVVYYVPEAPTWITGAYAGNPWAGALGTGMVAAFAVAIYPRQQVRNSDTANYDRLPRAEVEAPAINVKIEDPRRLAQ